METKVDSFGLTPGSALRWMNCRAFGPNSAHGSAEGEDVSTRG